MVLNFLHFHVTRVVLRTRSGRALPGLPLHRCQVPVSIHFLYCIILKITVLTLQSIVTHAERRQRWRARTWTMPRAKACRAGRESWRTEAQGRAERSGRR